MNKKIWKKDKDIIFRYIARPIAFIFVNPLIHTSVTANQVSALSIVLALFSAILISFSKYKYNIIACLVLQLVLVLDCLDGMLARYRNNLTKYGLYLEFLFHEIVPASLLFALGVNSYKYFNNVIPLYLGGITVLLIFFIIIGKACKERIVFYHIQKLQKIPKYFEHRLSKQFAKSTFGRPVSEIIHLFTSPAYFFTLLLILSIFNLLHYTIFFYSVFYFVIAIIKGYLEFKQGFKPYGLE